ncbi:MAG: YceD family protein [Gammaproteobacteria bacterium]|nr:YceD family protein [Gammaproteobacteria bacterium]MDD9958150.1 YceD family protein [Gammaproteobacteria bacterium]
MPESPIPAYIDTRKVFLQQDEINGSVALEKLPRFKDALASQQGHVSVALSFSVNESGQKVIQGKLFAEVAVTCQRCLEPLAIQLRDDIYLAVLEEEAEVAKLDPELDPWLCAEHKLVLAELVEEQLMLCMPIVNYHENQACLEKLDYVHSQNEADTAQSGMATENPFSVLKALKE